MLMTSRLKEVAMKEIPNITSDMIDKLKKSNINSIYQLAVQNPIELASEYENTSMNVESARVLIANARKILLGNGVLTNEFSTADEVLEKRNKLTRYTTGSEEFDDLLNGGFETQAITELVGEFAAGKSQICHTLCIAAQRLIEDNQHNDVKNSNTHSSASNIIFVDSENTFCADRI